MQTGSASYSRKVRPLVFKSMFNGRLTFRCVMVAAASLAMRFDPEYATEFVQTCVVGNPDRLQRVRYVILLSRTSIYRNAHQALSIVDTNARKEWSGQGRSCLSFQAVSLPGRNTPRKS